ncbi:hypothetical protein GCM10012275_00100 [Longimycelium tulufanense]|uniref:S26 family signal peptidase n=2 Tax=Longimycelium tulufanense TaxID=907463 RepID=A0A8J3C964_9PSEU|nr:hypothetical protein GCM10012275_00100 [Longimycelium tulufanense]
MTPALAEGDIVLVRSRAAPRPGDVVLVCWPARPAQLSVKRAAWPEEDGWYVLGDNGLDSTDSRHLGPARVLGVARWRLWPRPGRIPGVEW